MCIINRLLDLCIISCESRVFCTLNFCLSYVDVSKAASTVIIDDFSYMHTIGQHKRLSLTCEERDLTK